VEVLSAVVSSVANSVGAQTIVDVGAGQVCLFLWSIALLQHKLIVNLN
jgi:hypothetical protein